ncbi:hypothetical protein SAMN05421679_10737 [Epilithonimonas pallida]|uniref:Uncharacterized protein n=1 Tax=Epilithonimonas pallida TaxID=373671 RepID=A0ABY1R6K9_9FLAO|nr:hypothetical protein SAMN05421679_10737 [Epilithonimonas pallida]
MAILYKFTKYLFLRNIWVFFTAQNRLLMKSTILIAISITN